MKITKHVLTIAASLTLGNYAGAQDKITTEFKPSGNLWGYVFGDYAYKTHSDSLGRGAGNVQYKGATPSTTNPNPNGQMDLFQIRRAYLGYDYNISQKFSAYAVLAHEGGLDASGNNTLYLKYAYLKWANIFKGSNLLIGQMPTPSFATPFGTEPLWGYRSVERTIIDMHNNDASSDLGVSLQGNAWTQKNAKDSLKPSFLGYQIQVGNGASAKPEGDRFKKWRGTLFLATLQQKLTLGVYADYNTIQLTPYLINTITYKGYVHYKTDWFRIGAEVFQQTNGNGDIYKTSPVAKADTANGVQFGWSVFASSRIIKDKLNFFIRMDQYNPDTKFSKNNYKYLASATGGNMTTTTFYTQTFYSVGFDYTPFPRVHIMPNLWLNQYKARMSEDASGNALGARAKSDYDIVPRLTFYFLFNGSKKVSNNGMDY